MPNIIGDIAGRYDELMLLLKKMPDDEPISVGDMIDRGPKSKDVLDFFMKNGRAIFGNHEHLMIDYYRRQHCNQPSTGLWTDAGQPSFYDWGMWQYNGGGTTIRSFGTEYIEPYIEWVQKLPRFIELGDDLITHAFLHPDYLTLEQGLDFGRDASDYPKCDMSLIWNREEPIEREQWDIQICGHNSQFGLRQWTNKDGELYAICLDDSRHKKLTGFNTETGEIFQQEYL